MNVQEQRKYPRIKPPKSVVVAWQAGMQRGVSYVESMGLGGLFLRTKIMIPLRSVVVILLDMPVGQVRGRAIVRCIQQDQGVGVQIVAMEQEDRARLQRQLQVLSPA
jgi:hypothetical protein